MTTEPRARTDQRQLSNVSRQLPTHSPDSGQLQLLPAAVKAANLLPALERLCSSKTAVTLTEHQAETWLAALSIYDTRIVHEAVIRASMSADPFPDLGKLVSACDAIRREQAGLPSQDSQRLGTKQLKALALAWGLEV